MSHKKDKNNKAGGRRGGGDNDDNDEVKQHQQQQEQQQQRQQKQPSTRVNLFFRSLKTHLAENPDGAASSTAAVGGWNNVSNGGALNLWGNAASSPSPVRAVRIPASTLVLIQRQIRSHSERIATALSNWLNSEVDSEIHKLAEQVCQVLEAWLKQARAWEANFESDVIKVTVSGQTFPGQVLNFLSSSLEQKNLLLKLFEKEASSGDVLDLFKFSEFGDSVLLHLAISYDGGISSRNAPQGLTVHEWIDFFDKCLPRGYANVAASSANHVMIDESSPWYLSLE